MMAKISLQIRKPIVLVGQMGSGKSTLGKRLSQDLRLPFYDLDEIIANHVNQSIPEIFQKRGETEFRQIERFCLQKLLIHPNPLILSTGGGAPCFFDNMQIIRDNSYAIYLKTAAHVLTQRLAVEKDHRPLLKSLADHQLTEFLKTQLTHRKDYYEKAHLILDGSHSLAENSKIIQSFIAAIKLNN